MVSGGTRNVNNTSHSFADPINSAISSTVRHWRSTISAWGAARSTSARCEGLSPTVETIFMPDSGHFGTLSSSRPIITEAPRRNDLDDEAQPARSLLDARDGAARDGAAMRAAGRRPE